MKKNIKKFGIGGGNIGFHLARMLEENFEGIKLNKLKK